MLDPSRAHLIVAKKVVAGKVDLPDEIVKEERVNTRASKHTKEGRVHRVAEGHAAMGEMVVVAIFIQVEPSFCTHDNLTISYA